LTDHLVRGRRTRLVALVSAGALLASTVGASATDRFDDVESSSVHASAIAELNDRDIMLGTSATTFHPGRTLTRAQLASVLVRASDTPPYYEPAPFTDELPAAHAANIAAAEKAGLIRGFPDGTFRPNQEITRDQIALMLWRWLSNNGLIEDEPDGDFTDLGDTAHGLAINSLAAVDIAQGFRDGSFKPRASTRRDQAASFVWRAVAYKEAKEDEGEVPPHPWDEVGQDVLATDVPAGDISGVEYHGRIDLGGAAAVNPVRYELGETLVTTGRFGMRIYDLRDRYEPKLIGELPKEELALPGDNANNNYHTAESLNIDKERNLAFLSRDPRAFGRPQSSGISGFYIIDIDDPTAPELLRFHEVGAGHTSTCVNDCDFIWSGGPARDVSDPEDWIARPIFVTDVRDPDNPVTYPNPVDTGRYRGITDYAHDVQVDQAGVAWVSGRGGVRGYWTEGIHWDPTQDRWRTARAFDPVPYAGGEVGEYNDPDDPRRLAGAIHNMERPIDGVQGPSAWTDSERPFRPGKDDGADLAAGGYEAGELVYVTDENFTAPCSDSGKFYIASLKGADQGQAWRTAEEVEEEGPFALDEIGVWSVAGKEGTTNPNASCSAHYFNMQDGIVAGGWYGQGFRFLDVTDPTDPFQVAYFRPNGGSGWSTHWIDEIIYANDINGGIHILTLDGDAAAAAETRTEVLAPAMSEEALAAEAAQALFADPVFGWSCALPAGADIPAGPPSAG
jgi:hypothetical protein